MTSRIITQVVLTVISLASAMARPSNAESVTTVEELAAAVRNSAEGSTIHIGPGTYELAAPPEPKSRTTLKGAGVGQTIIAQADSGIIRPRVSVLVTPKLSKFVR